MSTLPLVSIIVPTRNRGILLQACLDGIYAQSYKHYEVLLLDDGSCEENRCVVRQLLRNYDSHIQWHEIHAEDTRGSGAAVVRNQGIALAKGKYIAFCDDDDYWCRDDHLQVAVSVMEQQQADVYFSGIRIDDTEGKIIFDKMMPNVENGLKPKQKLSEDNVYQITAKQILCYPDYAHLDITIVNKTLLDRLDGFWEHTCYAEDIELFVRVCDVANTILFRSDVCAVHNAPAQRQSASVTNRLSLQNKHLLEIMVYRRLLMVCQSKTALDYVSKSLSTLNKVVTEELLSQGNNNAAIYSAHSALAILPSIKWLLYTLWLHVRLLKRG
ncbi:MAG: glycosyltransferase [Methylovulum sp.]|nr:glycosyltransferase [Methylovulum sp.]